MPDESASGMLAEAGSALPGPSEENVHQVAVVLWGMSPALRDTALRLATVHGEKIERLKREETGMEQEARGLLQLADGLAFQHLSPNRVRAIRAKAGRLEKQKGAVRRAIAALERGFVPIPYLDNIPLNTDWEMQRLPFPVLKAIKELGLEALFDKLGLVEPQDYTLKQMTFREPAANNQVRVTTVLGRTIEYNLLPSGRKDPMLIGSIKVLGKEVWFMVGCWGMPI